MGDKLREEQAELSATYLNNIAVAVFAVGALAPVVAVLDAGGPATPLQVVGSVLCIVGSGALHLGARRILRRLMP